MKGKRLVVVMGDIVASERRPAPETHALFNAAVAAAGERHEAYIASPLTITLGDEFQGLVDSLERGFEVATDVRHALLAGGIDCRFVVGVVGIETAINRDRAWNMMGRGLSRARDLLNDKAALSRYRFATDDPTLDRTLEGSGIGMTVIERRWTDRQRADILASLSGESIGAIGLARGVSAHSVYKVRAAGDYDSYVELRRIVSETLAARDRELGLAA